ncbi:hypothetical protein Vadar_021834 [Vaccinium darrowii]|uniref:Uncharacterized protein n=1 Tax=Vaccinium darrowii TaxID=229202 RepID=A0ACB7X344_9ERIC|nr:hypothetical protein Vadar_021834 [Vaccinium darrowii]
MKSPFQTTSKACKIWYFISKGIRLACTTIHFPQACVKGVNLNEDHFFGLVNSTKDYYSNHLIIIGPRVKSKPWVIHEGAVGLFSNARLGKAYGLPNGRVPKEIVIMIENTEQSFHITHWDMIGKTTALEWEWDF